MKRARKIPAAMGILRFGMIWAILFAISMLYLAEAFERGGYAQKTLKIKKEAVIS